MTDQEKNYLQECTLLLESIRDSAGINPSIRAVIVNALMEHILKFQGLWAIPKCSRTGKKEFLIGLTFSDIYQLQNGGTINVNPQSVGMIDLPITIFFGGTHEHMENGLKKYPDAIAKFTDSYRDNQN